MLGLKSTALRLGSATRGWLVVLYAGAVVLWAVVGHMAGAHGVYYGGLALVGAVLAWQVATLDIDDSANCLVRFRANQWVGWLLLAGTAADMALRGFMS